MDNNSLIASKIKRIRIEKNILQKNVASALNLSENAYSRIENGYTQITINNLLKIIKILDCNLNDILDITKTSTTNNNSNIVFSQFNEGTLNITLTPLEFNELYKIIDERTKSNN